MEQLGRLVKAQHGYSRVSGTEMVARNGLPAVGEALHSDDVPSSSTALLSVQGMTCGACTSAVERALSALPGVFRATATLLQHSAEVDFDEDVVSTDALVAAVEDAGFDAQLAGVTGGGRAGDGQRTGGGGGGGGSGGGGPQVARLAVGGMTCAACSGAVERALMAVPGVQSAGVALTQGEAEVMYDGGVASAKALVEAVEDAGFEARLIAMTGAEQCTLAVEGMTCGACSGAVERAIGGVPGVARAAVDLLSGRAQVWYNPDTTGPRDFVEAAEAAGFAASLAPADAAAGDAGAAQRAELDAWRRLLGWAVVFTIPLFVIAMVLPVLGLGSFLSGVLLFGFPLNQVLKWALATPVQFFVGWRFHRGAWKALRRGGANMDVLVSLGTNASYVYSVICILQGRIMRHAAAPGGYAPTDFFETCAILITVVIFGKYLECSAKGRTSEAIKALLELTPESALLCELDAEGRVVGARQVATAMVHKGDVLKVLPGSRVPADGEVVEGSSYINEAMVTGESEPVLRGLGDPLIGGTLNAGGALLMRATRVGGDTVLAQIVRLVRRAQMSKAPIQAFADSVASVFVPAVVTLAALTWLAWFVAGSCQWYPVEWLPHGHSHFLFALLFGIAVLVIACPCALGLATPTAVMVGTGVGATHGILIKGGDALERGSHVDTVIFDKTGTLTLGRPQVTECRLLDGRYTLTQVCELAAAAEAASEHPLARAVLDYAERVVSGGAPPPGAHPALALRARSRSASADGQAAAPAARGDVQLTVRTDGDARPGADGGAWSPVGSPTRRRRTGQQQQQQQQRAEPAAGPRSPCGTPRAVSALVRAGGMRVSDVSSHPGRGITALLPWGSGGLGTGGAARGAADAGVLIEAPAGVKDAGGKGGGDAAGKDSAALHLAIGNRLLMAEQGVGASAEAEAFMQGREDNGETCVLIAINRSPVAVMAVSDPLKPEAPAVVAALQRQGYACHLLTGDTWRTARAVARRLRIGAVEAEVLPAGKAAVVQEQQALGRVVAMVGDGVNDSPALAAADVGMAIGSGTDIAVEAADYVLMRNSVEQVLVALDLSRATYRRIKLNFVWAMGYNVVMIPIAAGVLYPWFHIQMPPWVAGGCMVLSSVSVVASSLLLRRYRPPRLDAGLAAVRVSR